MTRYSDPAELLPRMRRTVALLEQRVLAAGHESVLHETYRSPERSQALVVQGVSRAQGLSMHCFRIAADLPCKRHMWSCEKVGCSYYTVLGQEASKLGLTWGGNWDGDNVPREQREHDLPHVQGVPLAVQNLVRRATLPQLEEMLAEYLRA